MATRMKVLIAGGGLGGCALAQGLVRRGFDVELFERSPKGLRAGFRLHMNADGGNALQALLPPSLYRLYQQTSRVDPVHERFLMLDSRLRHLGSRPHVGAPNLAVPRHTAVHRQTLRQILMHGLDDVIREATVIGYEQRGDKVAVRLEDGSSVEGDVLVGADGINSAVRRQLLPEVRVVDTGVRGIYGRSPLTPEITQRLPESLFDGFIVVFGPLLLDNGVLALGAFQPRMPYAEAVERFAPGVRLDPVAPYMMLGASIPATISQRLEVDVPTAGQGELVSCLKALVDGWNPHLAGLVDRIDSTEVFATVMRHLTVSPDWKPSRVTLLGDAIHAMPPTMGAGANLALRDACLLADRLEQARDGNSTDAVLRAIGAYEHEMRDYDFPMLRQSTTQEGAASGFTPMGLARLARMVGPVNLARQASQRRGTRASR
jgi:salicylate hydroxylase